MKKILIVEDECVIAQDIKTSLAKRGYKNSEIVASGEEAVKFACDQKPDIILMDILLYGKMDGFEAAKQINKLNIPVIYITAYGDKKTLDKIKRSTPFGYILKPFDTNKLILNINKALMNNIWVDVNRF